MLIELKFGIEAGITHASLGVWCNWPSYLLCSGSVVLRLHAENETFSAGYVCIFDHVALMYFLFTLNSN